MATKWPERDSEKGHMILMLLENIIILNVLWLKHINKGHLNGNIKLI